MEKTTFMTNFVLSQEICEWSKANYPNVHSGEGVEFSLFKVEDEEGYFYYYVTWDADEFGGSGKTSYLSYHVDNAFEGGSWINIPIKDFH